MQCIVIFGIQGSGKGTQAKLLSDRLGYQHVNIGDLLRDQVYRKTQLGMEVQSVISSGSLVDDDLIFRLIDGSIDKSAAGIVFDGFPRTDAQAEHLVANFSVRKVFYLELEESEALARIGARRVCQTCGENYNLTSKKPSKDGICDICGGELGIRSDDRPEAIHERMTAFYDQTEGLTRYFESLGLLTRIPADKSVEEVFQALLNRIS
jgi:adenylate kinase